MKAIVIEQTGGPEVLKLKDVPRPTPGPGQALIRNAAIGINYIDTYYRTGLYKTQTPYTPGQEVCGAIEAFGPQTTSDLKVGDRVVTSNAIGGYGEYCLAPVERLVPVPDGASDVQAC
ncbi:MAG TPA: alcohol dehydrogenase catalytic domain-containing protein, partial [Candidatus Elarobacter sp.]|nr:alcohol dehydrogenase catalytic domain-containing protein [Candidatus Elarobacter sp.]